MLHCDEDELDLTFILESQHWMIHLHLFDSKTSDLVWHNKEWKDSLLSGVVSSIVKSPLVELLQAVNHVLLIVNQMKFK